MSPQPIVRQSELTVPQDLQQALAATASVQSAWQNLTPLARWDFVHWVNTAKQPQTRQRRITRTCQMLAAGKRRPCCYSVVPLDLYTALTAHPKAKAQWSQLTPIERRNFISFLDVAQQRDEQKLRLKTICTQLAAGKRRPAP